MARPTEFDRDAALAAAMLLFWEQGYTSTSLAQLLHAMGISRSSFYAAFGDKRDLYLEVLKLFYERTRTMLVDTRIESPAERLRNFFDKTVAGVPRQRAARGCMMVNTVLELAGVDDELSKQASRYLDAIESDFEELLTAAGQAGYGTSLDPASGARYMMLVNEGLRVAVRQRRPTSELAGMIDDAFALLGLPAAA